MQKWLDALALHMAVAGNGVYLLILLVSILESTAFIGLVIPGTTTLIFAGFLTTQGILDFKSLVLVVAVGNIIGDSLSFYLGKRGTAWFKPGNKIFKEEYVARGERFFKKFGDKSILLARFIGPLRPVVPFVAGLFQMRARTFFIFNIIGGFLAALLYISVGYFFGRVTGQISAVVSVFKWISGSLIVLLILGWLGKRYMVRRGQEILTAIRLVFNPAVHSFFEHHARLRNWLKRGERAHFPVIFWLSVSLAFIISLLIGSGVVPYWLTSRAITTGDVATVSWLFAHREGWLTVLFLIITGLGKTTVASLLVLAAALLVWKYKKKLYLISLLVSVGGAGGMVDLIKHLVMRPRPEFIAVYPETGFSFPSGHAMFAAVFGGWMLYLISREARQWTTKVNVFFGCVSMMILISFSRLYLGVHYPSDVITGFIIGLVWLGIGVGVQKIWTRRIPLVT